MYIIRFLIFTMLFISLSYNVIAQEPDWNSYQEVLNEVKPGIKNGVSLMLVDYKKLKSSDNLNKAYQQLSSFDVQNLSNRNEKLAFYINAYNLLALKLVADHWPIESIKKIGSIFSPVWDKPAGKLAGKTVSLGEIEHKILRLLGDPRIHLAIVCASVSCPDLRSEPYTAIKLSAQLDDQTRQFLNNKNKGLRIENNNIRVSKIFDWFEEDFEIKGGVPAFIKLYKKDLPNLNIKANIPYDWNVNGTE